MKLLAPINATKLYPLGEVGDIENFVKDGVPAGWLNNPDRNEFYYMFQHSEADTVSIYSPEDLDYSSALWTVVAYVMADLDIDY